MTLSIRLRGQDYVNFVDARVDRYLEAVSSSFTFSATASNSQFIPIREGDPVEIIADGRFKIMTGFVDKYIVNYDAKNHTIVVQGRGKLSDLVDSTISIVKDYTGINFVELCELVIQDLKIDAEVINQVGDLPDISISVASAEIGHSAFNFLERFARRYQVLMTDDGDGNLVLTRASNQLSNNSLRMRLGTPDTNNIKSATRNVDISKLYNRYIAQSQLYPVEAFTETTTPIDLSGQIGESTDPEIRTTRILEFITEETSESFTLADRAKWEQSIRRARAFTYKATVQGHSFNNELWNTNLLYQINDDFANIADQLLCNTITYLFSTVSGSTTELGFTLKNAYTLQSELDRLIQQRSV